MEPEATQNVLSYFKLNYKFQNKVFAISFHIPYPMMLPMPILLIYDFYSPFLFFFIGFLLVHNFWNVLYFSPFPKQEKVLINVSNYI